MNFKTTLFLLILVTACGVKGPPTSPKGKVLPSFMQNYPEMKIDDDKNVEQKALR